MVVDVGVVKNHIKPKADGTLRNMRKDDLIEYIRCLENNYNVAVSFNENQAKYIESLDAVKVVRCEDCKHLRQNKANGRFSCMNPDNGLWFIQNGNEFCSYGERSEGE